MKIKAKKGKVFASVDGNSTYGNEIYLAKGDSQDNYIEIEERENICLNSGAEAKGI